MHDTRVVVEGKRKIWTAACWLKYSKNMQMIPLIFINFLLGDWWRTLNLFKRLFCIYQRHLVQYNDYQI
ncbi:hypothetical protein CFP56_017252 [Quercus suber]|uniref:Uncharacterized protein n=1 Tax=Quercus suber TaxID=58331 RepID=A0AAW0KNW8_QUESU